MEADPDLNNVTLNSTKENEPGRVWKLFDYRLNGSDRLRWLLLLLVG